MSEKTVKCESQFDEFLKGVNRWLKAQEELRENEATPERIEEILQLFEKVQAMGKQFAQCEFSPKKE